MRSTKRIRTVLYGDQKLSAAELEVIHTPAMQRLYGLHQLGLTDRVYLDASHSRIHHVVGVLHQVDKLVDAIIVNLSRSKKEFDVTSPEGGILKITAPKLVRRIQIRKPVIRFIGLLHDLTHAPFGHTLEDEIKLIGTKHDDPERQSKAFFRLLCQLIAWLSQEAPRRDSAKFPEVLRPFLGQGAIELPSPSIVGMAARELINGLTVTRAELCLKLTPSYIAEMLAHLGYAMRALLHLEVLHEKEISEEIVPNEAEYPFQEVVRTALEGTPYAPLLQRLRFEPHLDAFMLDIVGNTVCADLLDYAGRDSHFAGLNLSYDADRIAENFTLIHSEVIPKGRDKTGNSGSPNSADGNHSDHRRNPFDGWCLRTAISLVSHKYRTDVPSELMNLLNVRFYLYERVIFHSTKCAAGSMLGTSLQLLGFRGTGSGKQPALPEHLQFVGDDVFLHDIGTATDLVINELAKLKKKDELICDKLIKGVPGGSEVHNGLVPVLLGLRIGQTQSQVLEELRAARLLLHRLMSRRYFRPVYRLLPGTSQELLQLDAGEIADTFSTPTLRYNTEREIERKANLPIGTITIHCPKRNTAEKIADVFLTKPDCDSPTDPHCTLNEISKLDPKTFDDHEKAVKAVEKMYKSMWRLTVYVAPEHMETWEAISDAAGQAIFKTCDQRHGDRFPDGTESWPNDPNLRRELSEKAEATQGGFDKGSEAVLFGEDIARAALELLESRRLGAIPTDLYDPDQGLTTKGRERIEEALLGVIGRGAEMPDREPRPTVRESRTERIYTIVRGYVKQVDKVDEEWFMGTYPSRLDPLPSEDFELVRQQLEVAIEQSKEIDRNTSDHRGKKLRQVAKRIDELIKHVTRSRGAGRTPNLFGDDV